MTIYFIIYERFTNKYPCCFTIIPSVVSDVGKKKKKEEREIVTIRTIV